MAKSVIQIEDVSKMYRLGEVGTGTLSHDLHRTWAKLRGKPDPFAKVGVVNDRSQAGGDFVWALKDINLEIQEGEILGIIGRNGAGKSTLLKLLSRVTAPTTGIIKTRGRIASLLEVGTGFHPELTGRENIYLNGTILGMTRQEITARLEEIVEFSGCAKYIDTPVKRYSSGMMVRLGFSVAAHLECEILIVDEVLAVGDFEFQRKCLGQMKDLSQQNGRTILFVSHNFSAIKAICNKGCLITNGTISETGKITDVINSYASTKTNSSSNNSYQINNYSDKINIKKILLNEKNIGDLVLDDEKILKINVEVDIFEETPFAIELHIKNNGHFIASYGDFLFEKINTLSTGLHYLEFIMIVPDLMPGTYDLDINFTSPFIVQLAKVNPNIKFEIINSKINSFFNNQINNWSNVVIKC